MKEYLSIGKVSKLKGVSIKSLRYYDEIGILKPAYVNHDTNYRYYKPEQLFLIDAITLCTELGIPLKNLPLYQDDHGNWNFQKLLFDGKALAEEKIRTMRSSLESLQDTLNRIESGQLTLPPAVSVKEQQKRQLLCVPFDIATTPERYNHKLLELFVGADKAGLSASYPAGLLYEWDGQALHRFVFVHLVTTSSISLTNNDFYIKELPAASYFCSQSESHQIEDAEMVFSSLLDKKHPYVLVESSLSDSVTKKASFELQYLQC